MLLPAEIISCAVDPSTGEPVVVLKTVTSDRSIAVPVGPSEAAAIAAYSLAIESVQPLTIDLARSIMERLGGRLERMVIYDYTDHAFRARLFISAGQSVHIVECRPSDALGLALRCGAAVFIDEIVFDRLIPDQGGSESERIRGAIAHTDTLAFGRYFLGA